MSLSLYMDENVPIQITEGLRLRDVDVYTRYQAEPGNADPEALPPFSQPRQSKSDIGSQEEPGNQLTSY